MCASDDTRSTGSTGREWLLRRADQATVAVLTMAGLISTVAWWIGQGGLQGRLIEVERGASQGYQFRVDINTADWPELAQLPGVGPSLARRIIEHREVHGRFGTLDEVGQVKGVGPKTLEAIRPYVLVTGRGGRRGVRRRSLLRREARRAATLDGARAIKYMFCRAFLIAPGVFDV